MWAICVVDLNPTTTLCLLDLVHFLWDIPRLVVASRLPSVVSNRPERSLPVSRWVCAPPPSIKPCPESLRIPHRCQPRCKRESVIKEPKKNSLPRNKLALKNDHGSHGTLHVHGDQGRVRREAETVGGSRLSASPILCFLPSDATVHLRVETTSGTKSDSLVLLRSR